MFSKYLSEKQVPDILKDIQTILKYWQSLSRYLRYFLAAYFPILCPNSQKRHLLFPICFAES